MGAAEGLPGLLLVGSAVTVGPADMARLVGSSVGSIEDEGSIEGAEAVGSTDGDGCVGSIEGSCDGTDEGSIEGVEVVGSTDGDGVESSSVPVDCIVQTSKWLSKRRFAFRPPAHESSMPKKLFESYWQKGEQRWW